MIEIILAAVLTVLPQTSAQWGCDEQALEFRGVNGLWVMDLPAYARCLQSCIDVLELRACRASCYSNEGQYLACRINVYDLWQTPNGLDCWPNEPDCSVVGSVEVYSCPGLSHGVPIMRWDWHKSSSGETILFAFVDGDCGESSATTTLQFIQPRLCEATTFEGFTACRTP